MIDEKDYVKQLNNMITNSLLNNSLQIQNTSPIRYSSSVLPYSLSKSTSPQFRKIKLKNVNSRKLNIIIIYLPDSILFSSLTLRISGESRL